MVKETEQDEAREVPEEGHIYSVYRPKVRAAGDEEEVAAEGLGDVENFYVVLKPHGGRFRLINIGRKRLPDIDGHERLWGFVEAIAGSGKAIEEGLRRETYDTKTRGEHVRPTARPAGEGVYAIVRQGPNAHLAWALELPEKPGPVQKAFNIPPEASLVVSIRNPEKGGAQRSAQLGEDRKAHYPKHLQEEFRDRKFATEDPRLLGFEGAQLVLIGARDDPEQAYGIDLEPQEEDESSAEIFRQLRFARPRHPVEPLLAGEWR